MKMKSYTYIPLRVSRNNRPHLVHHALVSVVQEVRCPEAHAAEPHVHCDLAGTGQSMTSCTWFEMLVTWYLMRRLSGSSYHTW